MQLNCTNLRFFAIEVNLKNHLVDTMAFALPSVIHKQCIPQMLIGTVPNMKIFYCVSQTTEHANLYIESSHGKKYKIYKRSSGSDHMEYKSLVAETMFQGTGWKEFENWYYSNNLDSLLFMKETIDGTECGEIHLNGDICNKICYNGQNVRIRPEMMEDINLEDIRWMIKWYLIDLRKHISIDLIKSSMLYYKIYTYLPSNGYKISNETTLFLMQDELNVDRFDMLCQGQTHTFVEEWEYDV